MALIFIFLVSPAVSLPCSRTPPETNENNQTSLPEVASPGLDPFLGDRILFPREAIRLKKTSEFYKIDYLAKEGTMEWLLNLEKYSKIKDYSLTGEDAEKIWDTADHPCGIHR